MFSTLPLRTKIMLGGCVPLILVIILGVMSRSSINTLLETSERVDHTHKVIQQAMQIEAAAVDMETGMRGYLLAGDQAFLDPYRGGRRASPSTLPI